MLLTKGPKTKENGQLITNDVIPQRKPFIKSHRASTNQRSRLMSIHIISWQNSNSYLMFRSSLEQGGSDCFFMSFTISLTSIFRLDHIISKFGNAFKVFFYFTLCNKVTRWTCGRRATANIYVGYILK